MFFLCQHLWTAKVWCSVKKQIPTSPTVSIAVGNIPVSLTEAPRGPYLRMIGKFSPMAKVSQQPLSSLRVPSLLFAFSAFFCGPVSSVSALDWQPSPGGRFATLAVPAQGQTGFSRLPSAGTGLTFSNHVSIDRYTTNQVFLNGSGVAAGDIDGDGWCDLFFAGLEGRSRLYRNLGGWKFADVTKSSGIDLTALDATGAAFADLDGDGDLDLAVNSFNGGTHIFLNDGAGRFTKQLPLNPKKCGASIALADLDGDGDLDLYIANYRGVTMRDEPKARFRVNNDTGHTAILEYQGRPVTEPSLVGRFSVNAKGKITENGEAHALYRNDGAGRFTALSFTDGTFLDEDGKPLREPPYDWGLSVMMRDLNGDGVPDIYVCNDFASPDRIWLNNGRGQFRAMPRTAIRHTSMFSMGVDFADVDRDGLDDFFVVDMMSRSHLGRHLQIGGIPPYDPAIGRVEERLQFSHNTLFKNRGDGTFAEVAWLAGVEGSEWSWTPIFLDVDLDGFEDLLITNGHERDAMNADVMDRAEGLKRERKMSDWELLNLNNLFGRLDSPNVAFRNRGDLTFEDVSAAWGFDTRAVSQGMCLADLDNDGDMDVVMNNLNEEAGVYRNTGAAPRVAVRLQGLAPNTAGIGAKITVRGGAVTAQSQEMICGGRYLSGDQAQRVFAAGSATNELTIEVTWRGGSRSVVTNARGNRIYEVRESTAGLPPGPRTEKAGGTAALRFEDASSRLGHTHHEEPFDDFARQPLLPWRLSQLGPGVAWQDVDGDGWEDLVIGSGKGGALAVYRNDGRGGWARMTNGVLGRAVGRDQTGVVGMGSLLFVGSANYEDGRTNGGSLRVYDLARGASGESVLGPVASTGPLALADVDGDGDLDLFVGGRVIAGRYPEAAMSQWLRNEGGRFVPAQRWEQLGLVSGAVFSDLNGDGWPELIVACEWGPLKIFRNEHGKFSEWDAPVRTLNSQLSTLSHLRGWWHGVTMGDFDGDGRLDIVASNWGRNSRYRGSPERPWRLHYGDMGAGTLELVEGRVAMELGKEAPERGWRMVRGVMPLLQERIGSYEAYGKSSLAEIYGEGLSRLRAVEVNTVASVVLLNRGGEFELRELPGEAQWSPGFGLSVADADGDGVEDIFMSQNFFSMNPESEREDAGRGVWLRGDGRGGFTAVAGQESGVKIYGEQRGCAVADFDGDGRVDLVVTQNGAETLLFHNTGAHPGLRVRLRGGAGNPSGAGAVMRLVSEGKKGPAREVHAGSGYWSQDGAVQVLGPRETATAVWVRWPGGNEKAYPVSAGAREVELSPDGAVRAKP